MNCVLMRGGEDTGPQKNGPVRTQTAQPSVSQGKRPQEEPTLPYLDQDTASRTGRE